MRSRARCGKHSRRHVSARVCVYIVCSRSRGVQSRRIRLQLRKLCICHQRCATKACARARKASDGARARMRACSRLMNQTTALAPPGKTEAARLKAAREAIVAFTSCDVGRLRLDGLWNGVPRSRVGVIFNLQVGNANTGTTQWHALPRARTTNDHNCKRTTHLQCAESLLRLQSLLLRALSLQ